MIKFNKNNIFNFLYEINLWTPIVPTLSKPLNKLNQFKIREINKLQNI